MSGTTERSPGLGFALVLGMITLIGPLTIHLFLPAMPEVKIAFGASDALVQLAFSVSLVAMAVVTPLYGSLSDRYGRRPVLLGGLLIFLVGTAAAAVAPTLEILIAARLVQAVGSGCGVTLTRAIARDAYGPAVLVKAIAYLTMAYTFGPMLAPMFGGIIIDSTGWRGVFWFAFAGGTAIVIAAYFVTRETLAVEARDNHSRGVMGHYVALLRNARFMAFALQSGFMSFSFFALAASAPFLMKDLLGRTATEFGVYFVLFPVGYFTGNLVSSRLSGRVGIEKMVMAGSVLCFAGIVVQSGLITAGYLTPLIIFGFGGLISFAQGLSLPNAQAGAIRINPALAGTAAGLSLFVQMLLSAVAAELYGLFADGTPMPTVVLALAGAALAVVASGALFVKPRPRKLSS